VTERDLPDVVVMDACLPGLDGLDAARKIFSNPNLKHVRVIMLSDSADDDQLFGALRAGASAYLVKDTAPAELLEAVRAVARGETLLSRAVTGRLIAELVSQPDLYRPSPEELEELTSREREVMALVAGGLNNHEIAEQLVISVATAKTHVSRTLRKVDARDRAQLVALAYETGLVHPRQPALAVV
jgi:DNA-binding NarL/FixJ family response regulator